MTPGMASKVDSTVLSVISEDKTSARKYENSDDFESVYNQKSRSAYAGGHKKKLHPLLLGPSRQGHAKYASLHAASKSNLSEFTQRIMSAKLLRVKQVQNQLTETQIQLNELINENRILRNLQKRQEGALKKYEGNHAELPQLIRSHNEEIRTLKANNKIIKAQLRESNGKLKERESELETLKESYSKLKKLSSEKNLLEREKLQKRVEELQDVIKEQDERIQVLSRKVLLESKNYRHHLSIEVNKHKETQKDLNNALAMISKLESQLLAREKLNLLPGMIAKNPLKRETKNLMPTISNKAMEIPSNVGTLDTSYRDDADQKQKLSNGDSQDTDSELLNVMMSSDETPSPTPDIFPDINPSRKKSSEIKTSTEISTSKQEMFQLNCDVPGKQCGGLQARKTPLPKRNSKTSSDIEANAKMITEKLAGNIETIENIVQEKSSNATSPLNRSRINSLYEEVRSNASRIENEINSQLVKTRSDVDKINQEIEEVTKIKITDIRRNVPKRKLDDEKRNANLLEKCEKDENDTKELTEPQQQKLISMSKTWNDIKDKIQEERMKAEQKMRELCKSNSSEDNDRDEESSDSQAEEDKAPNASVERVDLTVKQELEVQRTIIEREYEESKERRFPNFTNDEFILTELERTDKMFKKLKNENRKPLQKSSSLGKRTKTPAPLTKSQSLDPKVLENINYRTESHREPKFLEQFQNEQQKQNLLKALKAIDVGKDPNLSSDESNHSENEDDNSYKGYGLKHIQRISSSTDRSKSNLMSELFGSSQRRLDRNDNIKLEYGSFDGISARDD